MTIQDIAVWTQILSSVAVLATLIYLVIETRQNTQALHQSSRQAALDSELNLFYKSLDHPDMYSGASLPSIDGVSEDKKFAYYIGLLAIFRIRENYWFQYINGAMEKDMWNIYKAVLINQLANKNSRVIWNFYSPAFHPNFVKEINSEI